MRWLILLLAAMLPFAAGAQTGTDVSGQDEVQNAVKPYLAVVCGGYKLKSIESGKLFGRNNRREFSQAYTLAVNTDSGMLFDASVSTPWKYDADFEKYRDKYHTVLSTLRYRRLKDMAYQPSDIKPTAKGVAISTVKLDNKMATPMHCRSVEEGETLHGWLVWLYVSDTLGSEKWGTVGEVSTVRPVLCDATFSDKVRSKDVKPPFALVPDVSAMRKAVGAVWVIPAGQKNGKAQYDMAGLAVVTPSGWSLVPMSITKPEPVKPPDVSNPPDEGQVTPKDSSDVKKKVGDRLGRGSNPHNKKQGRLNKWLKKLFKK